MDYTVVREYQRMGNQDTVPSIPLQKTQRRNVGQLLYKNVQYGLEDMDTDGLAFLV